MLVADTCVVLVTDKFRFATYFYVDECVRKLMHMTLFVVRDGVFSALMSEYSPR